MVLTVPGKPRTGIVVDCRDAEKTLECCRREGIERLTCVVATHPHWDHVVGLKAVIQDFGRDKIDEFWYVDYSLSSKDVSYTRTYRRLLEYVDKHSIDTVTPVAGYTCRKGRLRIEVISPLLDVLRSGPQDSLTDFFNNTALAFRVLLGRSPIVLLASDIEEEAWGNAYTMCRRRLRAPVLKVSHHGSQRGTSTSVFDKVKPKVCVVSVGVGHPELPHPTTMNEIKRWSAGFRTDEVGEDIVVEGESSKVVVRTASGAILYRTR